MKTLKLGRLSLVVASALGLATVAQAQLVINDTLTGASSSYNWQALNGACLTAGDGRTSTIPACVVNGSNMSYYSGKTLVGGATGKLPDAIGSGALRLTNGDTGTGSNGNNQTGAVVSNFTFPTNQGVQVTWTSVTYGGNAYQNNAGSNNKSGADGISFFLSDGAQPPTVGALGGSLGYSCSNGNGTYDGVVGGYIGIGMDEFGNFSNSGDNTSSGASTGQTPGAIVIRGAGHTAWAWLTANYPQYYSSTYTDPATAVHTTCKTGNLYNFTGGSINVNVPGPTNYTANYSSTKTSCTSSCAVTTGSITSTSSIPSTSTCDKNGNVSSSGSHNCTYTNITSTPSTTTQSVANGAAIPSTVVGGVYKLDFNYPYLTGSNFPSGTTIFNQEAAGTTTSGGVTYSKAVRGPASTASGPAATPITYSLTITQAGVLTFSYAINGGSAISVIPSTTIPSFNIITANNGYLPSSFRFGFSAGTGGGSNVHEITCFKAAPANTSGSTAGSNVLSSQVQTSSQIYLAYFHPTNSWGSLTAQNLQFTAATGSSAATLAVLPGVVWDAGCVLTGGPCLSQTTSTGTVPTVTAPLTYATRVILGWNGSTGIPFRYGNLPSAQSTALTAGDSTATSNRTDYLRGNQAMEVSQTGGIYRTRTSLLGDIVDSSPVWVGPPNLPYSAAWSDLLYPTATAPEASTYGAYVSGQATRTNVVYAGANDGMLHGFRAGSYSAAGVYNPTNNDGQEVLSYVPAQVATAIHSATNTALDFSSPSYSHNFYVDASPATGDLYYGSAWHTWVVGGLGPGGQANGPVADTSTVETGTVFALDVTDPTTFAETAASSLVKGEWSSASLNSVACTGSVTSCGDHLGATYGTPTIRRLHDGGWALIFGNGLNSKLGTAGLFIVHINPADGTTKSVQYIDTGVGSTTNRNGIVQATPVDLDGDHITDYVYAGDVQGNVWRFDLTSATAAFWSVGPKLFTTQSGQPITSGIAVAAIAPEAYETAATNNRVILAFGTGQKLPKTLTADTSYPSAKQSIYGIWDANMTAWNALSTTDYAALVTPPTIVAGASGNLRQSALNAAANSTDSANSTTATVCWKGSTACGTTTGSQMGWEMDLTVTSAGVAEQVLFNPLIVSGVFNTNTSLPVVAQALTCDASSQSAFSYGIDMGTGGAAVNASTSGTTTTTSSYFSGYAAGTVRVATQATGTSSYVTTSDGGQWLVFQKNDGTGGTLQINPQGNGPGTGVGSRLTWTKMR